MNVVGVVSALVAFITTFTDKGNDEYGCTKTTGKTTTGGVPYTNMMCSRQIATCKYMGPIYDKSGTYAGMRRWAAQTSCNLAVSLRMRTSRESILNKADCGPMAAIGAHIRCRYCYRHVRCAGAS